MPLLTIRLYSTYTLTNECTILNPNKNSEYGKTSKSTKIGTPYAQSDSLALFLRTLGGIRMKNAWFELEVA